jgi:acyl-CoA synthetase
LVRPFLTLHHPESAARYYEEGLWTRDTFYLLLQRHASARPEAIAVQDGRSKLTWSELQKWVDGTAAALRSYGLVGGDCVSIWASSRIESIVTFLACSREGFVCNPTLHRNLTCTEVGALLDKLSSRCLVTEPDWGDDRCSADFDAILASIPSLRVAYTPQSFPLPAPYMAAPSSDPDKIVYLAFTSGTIAAPKCVMHSDNTLLASARDLVRDWGHDRNTVLLTLFPLSHHMGWAAVAQWLLAGCLLVTNDPPAGMSAVDWILATRATYVIGMAPNAADVIAEQSRRRLARLGSVKIFSIAAAPTPLTVVDAFVSQGIRVQSLYGMTENSPHRYTHPTDDVETVASTSGKGGRAYEICLFDLTDPDRPADPGEIGQIGGRGAALMLGYYGNQTGTQLSFNRDGWFMSGDLGLFDSSGNLRIEGRLNQLIVRGGHNIHPARIEALAVKLEKVRNAACFGIPDERLGERACVAVIGEVQPAELSSHLAAEGLAKGDMPELFLKMVAFPLTANGTILKRFLRDMVRRRDVTPVSLR